MVRLAMLLLKVAFDRCFRWTLRDAEVAGNTWFHVYWLQDGGDSADYPFYVVL